MLSSKQADAAGGLFTFQSKLTSFERRPHRRSDGLGVAVLGKPMHDAEGLYSVRSTETLGRTGRQLRCGG